MQEPKTMLTDALVAERLAWAAVKDRQPGTPDHDVHLWARWLTAAENLAMAPVASTEAPARPSLQTSLPGAVR